MLRKREKVFTKLSEHGQSFIRGLPLINKGWLFCPFSFNTPKCNLLKGYFKALSDTPCLKKKLCCSRYVGHRFTTMSAVIPFNNTLAWIYFGMICGIKVLLNSAHLESKFNASPRSIKAIGHKIGNVVSRRLPLTRTWKYFFSSEYKKGGMGCGESRAAVQDTEEVPQNGDFRPWAHIQTYDSNNSDPSTVIDEDTDDETTTVVPKKK